MTLKGVGCHEGGKNPLPVEQITTWQAKALSVKRFTPGSDVLGAYSVLPV